tara:strand:+ start:50 stop:322 length:273 start_codon:yes stop_codon:yes gene_type:complete
MRTETNYLKGKIIAEFMGIDQVDIDTYQETNSNLKYHTSWDWLMPVVQKCRQENRLEYFDRVYYALEECDINVTYRAVVEFINQLNKQTK